MQNAEIIIVGGGPAGLSTAGALKRCGLNAVVLDKNDRIGDSWLQRYKRLHLHTVRGFSGLAHYPIPRHFPKYIHKDLYAEYLQDYANHFDLQCVMNSRVLKVRTNEKENDDNLIVKTNDETWRSPVVVIATGQFGTPIIPNWSGLDEFQGTIIHSVEYKTGGDYVGKRVLVIGSGNSGAEIAADLAECGAESVAISIRTPPAIVPRDFLGTPTQIFGILMSRLPPRFADRVGSILARLALGDLRRYGIKAPAWLPFTSKRTPIIDVGFIKQVKSGNVKVRPTIASFRPAGVVYHDGQEESLDAVIAATGFTTGLDQLLEIFGILDVNGFPLYPPGRPTPVPGLFFMGFIETNRGHLYEANIASRQLAKIVVKYLSKA